MSDTEDCRTPIDLSAESDQTLGRYISLPEPRLAGKAPAVDMEAYYRLEQFEIDVRLHSMSSLSVGIRAWLTQLRLFHVALTHCYVLDSQNEAERMAANLRLWHLGVASRNSKYALDGILGGNYVGSLAIIRTLVECWRRIAYVRLSPKDVWRWIDRKFWPNDLRNAGAPESWRSIPNGKEIAELVERQGSEFDRVNLNISSTGMKKLNPFAHPSSDTLVQVLPPDVDDSAVSFAMYNGDSAVFCMGWGLAANWLLLPELALLDEQEPDWDDALQRIEDLIKEFDFSETPYA